MIGLPKIDGYQADFTKLLGEGTYGKVFPCTSLNPNEQQEQLCVKIISVMDGSIAQREEKILQLLSQKAQFNQNIVKLKKVIYDETQKLMSVVMEKCSSNLLVEWNVKKVYTNEETMDILKQLLNGYKPLYENKIIHRDLKPENILTSVVNNKIIYKLSDFGIGKIYQRNDAALSKIGTPVYSAPECNFLQNEYDEIFYQDYKSFEQKSAVDMYSLGIILYQLLFGTFPFVTNQIGIHNFIKELKDQPFKIINTQNKDQKLIELIERMIVFLPSKRITFNELYQLFFQETLTQRKMLVQTVQIQKPQLNNPTPQQEDKKQQVQFPQPRMASEVTPRINQPQQQQRGRITILKDYTKGDNQVIFNNYQQPSLIQSQYIPQNQQFIPGRQIFGSIQNNQVQNDFNNQTAQQFISELKESLSFLLNVAEISAPAIAGDLENSISKLNSNNLNKISVQQVLYPLRQHYKFKHDYNYSSTFIRFLFIFTYFAYGKQIPDDLSQLSEMQMRAYLTQWHPQQK